MQSFFIEVKTYVPRSPCLRKQQKAKKPYGNVSRFEKKREIYSHSGGSWINIYIIFQRGSYNFWIYSFATLATN